MFFNTKISRLAIAFTMATVVAACDGDSNTELASLGSQGDNPGTQQTQQPTSGDGGGGGTTTTCPEGTTEVTLGTGSACQVSGVLTSDLTLTNDNTYLLEGKVEVGEAAAKDGTGGTEVVLTIEPGTVVAGSTDTSYLLVTRGSRINAAGTASNPIIMTSKADIERDRNLSSVVALNESETAEWGGLVINGLAPINVSLFVEGDDGASFDGGAENADCSATATICETTGEGDSGLFGGDDVNDNSGVLKYVQVRYAGHPFSANNELNGIAFQGVGAGTEVEYVHVHNGSDDGIEFFGGTVNARFLVVTGAGDDSIDWTMGYRGKIHYALVMASSAVPETDNCFEMDNFEFDQDAAPISKPIMSNITCVGTTGSSDGFRIRHGTGVEIFNSVVAGYDDGFDVDNTDTYVQLRAGNVVMKHVFLDNPDDIQNDVGEDDLAANFDGVTGTNLTEWFAGQAAANSEGVGNTLSGFINGAAENNVGVFTLTDSFFAETTPTHIGAVSSDSTIGNWTTGWTYGLNPAPTCPAGTSTNSDGNCVIEGVIQSDLRLNSLAAGNFYLLNGRVEVGVDCGKNAATPLAACVAAELTIDPGVTIKGATNQAYLIVNRGSKLNSNGTSSNPVTFTGSGTTDADTSTALWGGLVLNGQAFVNSGGNEDAPSGGDTCGAQTGATVCEFEAEGSNPKPLFGGDSDTSSCGQMYFTQVLYAGRLISNENELNGIAFNGCGSGTSIENVQVHNAADDGVEFFGGTVNAKKLVVTGAGDDSVDWTLGYRGNLQYVLVVHNTQSNSERCFEMDNFGANTNATPRAEPFVSNFTCIGTQSADTSNNAGPADGVTNSDAGLKLRAGSWGHFYNGLIENFGECIDISTADTTAGITNTPADVDFRSVICDVNNAAILDDGTTGDIFSANFGVAAKNNQITTTAGADNGLALTFDGASATSLRSYINTNSGLNDYDASTADSFFDNAGFVGAVSSTNNWTTGWTIWLNETSD